MFYVFAKVRSKIWVPTQLKESNFLRWELCLFRLWSLKGEVIHLPIHWPWNLDMEYAVSWLSKGASGLQNKLFLNYIYITLYVCVYPRLGTLGWFRTFRWSVWPASDRRTERESHSAVDLFDTTWKYIAQYWSLLNIDHCSILIIAQYWSFIFCMLLLNVIYMLTTMTSGPFLQHMTHQDKVNNKNVSSFVFNHFVAAVSLISCRNLFEKWYSGVWSSNLRIMNVLERELENWVRNTDSIDNNDNNNNIVLLFIHTL